ncbi:MAG: DnaD domain protein [Clostridia bacterium]|nr:DnaD domain protein [Clostridia bacterium]
MSKSSKLTIQYRSGRLPEALGELLANADETDLRVLIAAQMLADENGVLETGELASTLSLSEGEVSASLKFWRGAGVLTASSSKKKTAATLEKTPEKAPEKAPTAHRAGAIEQSGNLPSYTTSELADLIEQRRVSAEFIDEAQRVMGKVFRTYDTGVLVGIVDRLGFEEAAVLAMLAYIVQKGKKTLRYAEQMAISFYDEGITDTADVLERLGRMERSGEVIGKIRVLYGAAGRELTTSEKRLFTAWTEKLAYDIEVIRMAYDITVDAIQKPVPKYTNSILEAWYAQGLRTADEVRSYLDAEKKKKDSGASEKSYDIDEFIEAALKRSYEEMM